MADEPGQFGRVEIPVEFSTKGLKASAKGVSKVAQEEGRAIAKEMMAGLERQFQLDMARIKDGQARGFISPKEARKAGQEAAAEFNKGVLQVVDQAAAAGAFRGKAGKQLFSDLTNELKNVGEAGRRGGLGLGRLNDALFTVMRMSTGTSVIASKLMDTLGTFAIGVGPMIPIVAGLAAVAAGIAKVGEEARKEREALDESTEALLKNARARQQGTTGDLQDQKAALEKRIADLRKEIGAREEAGPVPLSSGLAGVFIGGRTQKLREEQMQRKVALMEAEAELRAIERDEQANRQRQIREGIEVANRIEEQGQRDRERIAKEGAANQGQRDRERIAKEGAANRERLEQVEASLRVRLAELTANAQDDLMLVIDQLEQQGRKAAAEAGVEVSQAFLDGIGKLRAEAGFEEVLRQVQDAFKDLRNEDRSDASQQRLQHFIGQLREYASTLTQGSTIQTRFNDLIRQAAELHDDNAAAIERETKAEDKRDAAAEERQRREELRDLRDKARALEENARAAIQLANAIGAIGDSTADALNNLAQLGASIFRIANHDPTAIPSAIGAAAQLAKGLFGTTDEERQERLRQIEAMVDLTKALEDLQHAVLHDLTDKQRQQILKDLDSLKLLPEKNGTAGVKDMTAAQLYALRRLEEVTGIPGIFDSSTGKIDMAKLNVAFQQLQDMDIGVFPKSIQGSIEARHFQDEIAGARDAETKLDDFLTDVSKYGGGKFGEAIRKAIADGGPQAANKMLDDWARRLAAGDQSLFAAGGPFDGLNADEVRDLLQEGNSILEEWLETVAGGTTQDFVQARSITEVTATRMLGLDLTRNVLLTQIRDLIAGQMGVDAASLSATSGFGAAARAGLPTSAGMGGITLQIAGPLVGEVTLTGQAGIVGSAQAQAEVESMMVRALEGALDSIDQRMGDRYLARLRAGGRA